MLSTQKNFKKHPLIWASIENWMNLQTWFLYIFETQLVLILQGKKKIGQRILVSLSGNSTLRITSKLKIDFGSPIFWVDKKIEGITIWTLTYLYNGNNSYTKSHLTYRTRAIITRSWFETALDYYLRILGWKIEEFPCLEHKLSVILTALIYKPQ